MSSYNELDQTVTFLRKRNVDFSILQCTTSYPTRPEQYGLNVIKELKERYQVPIGFSDHSADIGTCIAATAMGAEIVEFHAVFSREDFGPDATSSIERIFEKSLAVNKNLPEGHILTFKDLEAKKPKGYGIDAAQFENVIGKRLAKSLKPWDFLNQEDIDE